MSTSTLLSICIPTYQRSALLRVMLETLMPQVAAVGDVVEVCIADNASTDETGSVIEAARAAHPDARVTYTRHAENRGAIRNLIGCATEQATGQYVWAIGDDDLLLPGAVARVVTALRAHPDIQLFYANFACASFPLHWPQSAHGGYTGPIASLACNHVHDRRVSHWQELLDPESSMGTHLYAHIVARSIWTQYWNGRELAPDYRSAESTYPHTAMLVEVAFNAPAHYLGMPHLVSFNERPGWADGHAARILLVAMPLLIAKMDDRGLGLQCLIRARAFLRQLARDSYLPLISGRGAADAADVITLSLAIGERYPELIDAMMDALQHTNGVVVPEVIDAVRAALASAQVRNQRTGEAVAA